MTQSQLSGFGLDRPESGDDVVVPFALEALDGRGRVVRLGEALDSILSRHAYPEPVARLLGEAVVLAALIGSALKFEGRFILQTQTDGPVNLIVVDLDAPDGLRGYARFDADLVQQAIARGETRPHQLLGKGHLAMTVDQGVHMERYQGIVALDGGTLEDVAHVYFQQSEQIPTLVRLAVAELTERGGQPSWRAGGVLVQHMPPHGGQTMPDLPGDGDFDNPETSDPDFVESDKWAQTKALLGTLDDVELADPEVSPERLLFRLYHETGVRVFDPIALEERCTCSAERIEAMLRDSFTSEERADMVVDGEIEVVCEFCSADYHFKPHEFETEH
ncbi:Hsp33 family molecular chaperone [Arsenicitalea aurantiaca]|uniref:Hsp33 family molecular chaperone n=1 Tax=Arsenicitalea aurantiaca TaxID=1783274 RepID=A0A433XB73_9HYPH|nr:Hsp33 family molecular chaperone [Arsenicitalea aurantiaca]RUT31325.1 Hsp33 family molecular chaperone [Arsenicitalea aurantiaca]